METKIKTKNKILAIKGHTTRGNEVIEILEMLGGANRILEGKDTHCFYYIQTDNNMIRLGHENYCDINDFIIFTLEEFLEKYPYKVGDKVQHKGSTSCGTIYVIEKMLWENNQIKYIIYNPYCNIPKCTVTVTAEDLQPYKEEIYTDNPSDEDAKTDITIDGEKLIAPKGYIIKTATMDGNNLTVEYVKKKLQYPKTYAECCKLLDMRSDWYLTFGSNTYGSNDLCVNKEFEYVCKLEAFRKLLICRDAYWKIAGDWKPNFGENFIYAIGASYGTIQKIMVSGGRGILIFPTEEMRDAFFENFKDEIEACKDYL